MKRLILFITTILSLQASAQILNGPQGYGKQEYRYRALNFLGLPVQDTVCDLIVNGTNGTCEGAVVYKPEDSTLYVRTASHWRPLAKGGDLGDYYTKAESDARYPLLSGSYSNPSWITGLAWSKITGAPTTLAGYGITDAIQDQTAVNQDASFRIAGNGYIGGNVGIGTTNPINPFTINSTTQLVENNYTTYGARIDQNGSRLALGGDTSASYLQTFNSLPLVLNGLGNNVGIGGIPTNKLSVVGSMNTTGTVTAGSIPARATPAPVFLTHTSGTLNTRTASEVLSDIGGAPATGSSSYVQINPSGIQPGFFDIGEFGIAREGFIVQRDGSNDNFVQSYNLFNNAGTAGANMQLTGGALPGLAIWVHDGTDYVERMRINSNGQVAIGTTSHPSGRKLAVIGGAFIDDSSPQRLNVSGMYTTTRIWQTDTDITVMAVDHTILLETSNTGTTQNIMLPDPVPASNNGRIIIFIENSSDTWNLNYTVINPAGPAFTVLPANTTTILQAINSQWYKIN